MFVYTIEICSRQCLDPDSDLHEQALWETSWIRMEDADPDLGGKQTEIKPVPENTVKITQ